MVISGGAAFVIGAALLMTHFYFVPPIDEVAQDDSGAERQQAKVVSAPAYLYDDFIVSVDLKNPAEDYADFSEFKIKHQNCTSDRINLFGDIDGTFPDIGAADFVENELNGVWLFPIKLVDGIWANVSVDGESIDLKKADKYNNYPHANQNIYELKEQGLRVERLNFCPDRHEGVVVEYTIVNTNNEEKNIQLSLTTKTDLLPIWPSADVGDFDAKDVADWDEDINAIVAKDEDNPWHAVIGSPLVPTSYSVGIEDQRFEKTAGENGVISAQTYTVKVPAQQRISIPFVIAGSYYNHTHARKTFIRLGSEYKKLFDQKKQRLADKLQYSRISLPDKKVETDFMWNKFVIDWLVSEVPEYKGTNIGRGLTGNLPVWTYWFTLDSGGAIPSLLAQGEFELAKKTMKLLAPEGTIVSSVNPNGFAHIGDPAEIGLFIYTIWDIYQWTGDVAYVHSLYPTIQRGLVLITERDSDGDGLPEGQGQVEHEAYSMELLDNAVYTQRAFDTAAKMAALVGDTENVSTYTAMAEKVKEKIETLFWQEDKGIYADVVATPAQLSEPWSSAYGASYSTLQKMQDPAIDLESIDPDSLPTRLGQLINDWSEGLLPEEMEYLTELNEEIQKMENQQTKRAWSILNTALLATPMEAGIASPEHARRGLSDSSKLAHEHVHPEFSDPAIVVGYAKYDQPEGAMQFIQKLQKRTSALYANANSNDFYGLSYPVVAYFFGIQPDAANKKITVRPRPPQAWGDMSIENVKVGNTYLSVKREKKGSAFAYTIMVEDPSWTVTFIPPEEGEHMVNGEMVQGAKELRF